ncbi:unnamed protein product [Polarella glacialis]|uniref:Uncharacterized protein n=1 Tax=Polarella glacialis TaxID=89957 RepID=A0A813FQB3_POLGL|nr:unnamed protein product [Polarella glacialis]
MEDVLEQRPVDWFPGMAGEMPHIMIEVAKESPGDEQLSGKLCDLSWNREESQASTAVPDTYQRLISCGSTCRSDTQAEVCELSASAELLLMKEEYDDEEAMLKQEMRQIPMFSLGLLMLVLLLFGVLPLPDLLDSSILQAVLLAMAGVVLLPSFLSGWCFLSAYI